jgi:hypothetical protein
MFKQPYNKAKVAIVIAIIKDVITCIFTNYNKPEKRL